MENYSKNIQSLIHYTEGGIVSKVIFKDEHNNVTLFCMAAKTDMTEHTSTKEGTIYVIEGDGVFKLAGKDIKMLAGTIILMKKNAKHSITVNKNTTFLLVLHD